MISLSISGIDRTIANLEALERELPRTAENVVKDASLMVRRRLLEKMSDPGGSDPFWGRIGGAGNSLAVRSGQTRARLSPGGQVLRVGDRVFAEVGSPDHYVAAHEEGWHQARARIPTAAAQTAQGVDRHKGVGLRSIPGAFFLRSKAGNLWGAIRSGQRLVLLYLYRAVTHRGRHLFRDTKAELEPEIARMAQGRINAMVMRVTHGG